MPDLTAPTLSSSSTSNNTIVLSFSEAIAAGTGFITITDGATQTYMGKDGALRTRLVNATDTRTIAVTDTSQVTISGDTVTIALAADLKAGNSYSVQMSKGVLLDTAGNAYAGLSDTTQFKFSTATVAIPSAVIGGTVSMTDTGSSASDFITNSAAQTVAGTYTGTLAAGDAVMVSLDSGGTWNAATVNATNNTWSINGTLTGSSTIMARVVNAEGHYSALVRQAYTFDTVAPAEATITLSDSFLVAGETSTVTVTFNEAVTGLEVSDFTVDGGALSALSSSADGKTWTATLTPTHGVSATTGNITLNANSVADLAGNAGLAAVVTKSFNYSTVPNAPGAVVATASMTDTGYSSSDFITNSSAQAISGTYTGTLAADEFIQVSLDNGANWTRATATPASHQWSIPATTISAGNTLTARVSNGYTYSNPLEQAYTLDQTAPTATVTLTDSTVVVGETSLVTFTFSEAVKEFANADITVANGTLSTVSSSDGGVTWTATYTPTASVTDATNVITVNMAGLNDVAGNTGSGTASSANYAVDTARPTVSSITVADSALAAGETSTVTIVFSEAVAGFSTADLTVANGTISSLASSDNITWTATLTPTASVTDSSNVLTVDQGGVTDTAGNSGSGTAQSSNYTVSTVRPDVTSISVADSALTAGETTTVTFVFSEAVTGFDASDVSVANGTISTPTTSDNITWTATLTPSASVDDSTNVITLDETGIKNAADNAGTGSTASANYTVATVRPEATITVSDTALKAGDTATVTITFTETVTGLETTDFTVANGALSSLASSDNKTWTATLTPTSTIEDSSNLITLDNTGVVDSENNAGTGTTSSANYTVDTKAPTVTSMALSDSTLTSGQNATVTITFSEAVSASSFTSGDVTVTGGTLGTFTSEDNITWSATLTPDTSGSGSGSVQLAASSITDTAGNSGPAAAQSATFTYVVAPTVTIDSVTMTDSGTSGDFITNATSQTISGKLSAALGNSEFVEVSLDNGATWTEVPSFEGTNWTLSGQTISASNTLKARVSNDGATGTEYSQAYTLDQAAPIATIALSSSELITGETTTVTVTFDQAVSDLAVGDFKYSGTLSGLTSNEAGTVWTATLTPTTSGTGEVRLYASSVTDAAGNSGPSSDTAASFTYNAAPTATIASASITDTNTAGDFITSSTSQEITGTLSAALGRGQYVQVSLNNGATWTTATTSGTSWTLPGQTISSSGTLKVRATNGVSSSETYSHIYTLDQAAPTLTSISLSDSSLSASKTATVTAVFNEKVTGLIAGDFTVSGGSLGTMSSIDGITWTGTLTATASGSIALKAGSVTDVAGNTGPAAASSQGFDYSTAASTPTGLVYGAYFNSTGEQLGASVYYLNATSQTVSVMASGLGSGEYVELSLDNGGSWHTLTTQSNSGDWTYTTTISASSTLIARVSNSSGGTSTAFSHAYVYDAIAPTGTVTLGDATLKAGQTTSFSVTFSEAISTWTSAPTFTVYNGTLSSLTTSDRVTWTGTLTPDDDYTGDAGILISYGSAFDEAGNAATTTPLTYHIDTAEPTAELSLLDDTLTASTTLTLTLSEAVTDTPLASDFTVTGGTLGTFTSADGGLTWTTTLTPTANAYGAGSISLKADSIADSYGNTASASATPLSFNYDTLTTTPALTANTIALSSDTGDSTSDFITPTASQTISGSFTGTVYSGTGAKIEVSTDNGESWSSATVNNTTHTWSITKTLSGSSTIKVKLTDSSGATGTVQSQAYTIDSTAPASLSSLSPDLYIESDTYNSAAGGSYTDNITTADTPTIRFSLTSTSLSAGDYVDLIDTANNNAIVHTYTVLSGALGAYGSTVSVTPASALSEGTHTLVLRARDVAGNTGTQSSTPLSITIDKTLASMASKSVDLAAASDLGQSTTDNITSDSTPTVTVNVANTSGLAAGDLLQIIDTSNSNTVVGTHTVVASDYGASGANISITLNTLTAGTHTLALRALDVAGNSSTDSSALSITVDTTAPTAYVSSGSLPNFFGLGSSTPLSLVSGSLSAALGSGEYLQYSTDNGATWSNASTISTLWSITEVGVAYGGAIGLRVADTAGNISSYESTDSYTVYVGDGYGGTFTASGSKLLYAMGGNDAITVSGSGNEIYGGADDDTITVSALGSTVDGGTGADTVTVSASLSALSGWISGGSADSNTDTLSLTAGSQTLDLASVASNIAHFEKIQLASGDALTITPAAAASMSDTSSLYILGDSTNTLTLSGMWTATETILLYSAYYNAQSGITLYFRSTMASSLASPAETISSVSFSADTGSSASDLITKTAAQTISGTLSAALESGEYVEVSLNNGSSWTSATTSGTNWTLSGQTISDSGTLIARVSNGATTGTQYSHTYTLDQTAPGAAVSTSTTFDTTGSSAALTINGALTGSWTSGEYVEYSTDSGSTWTQASSTSSGAFTLDSVTGITGGMLGLRVSDTAGNVNPSSKTTYFGDTNGATATLTDFMWLYAGNGSNTITVSGSDILVQGGTGSDTINQTSSTGTANTFQTGSGADIITLAGYDSDVDAGAGNDTVTAAGRDHYIAAGDGDDTVTTTGTDHHIYGGDGNDTITVSSIGGLIRGGNNSGSTDVDTLVLSTSSQSLNLLTLAGYATEFEAIQLGTSSTLTLSAYATNYISDLATFKVVGDATNTVWVNYGEWTSTTTELVGVKAYTNTTYGMTLYLSTDVTFSVIPS